MTLDQLNNLINRGVAGIALMIIAFILIIRIFRKDIEKIQKGK